MAFDRMQAVKPLALGELRVTLMDFIANLRAKAEAEIL